MLLLIFWIIITVEAVAGAIISRAILLKRLNALMHARPATENVEPVVPGKPLHAGPVGNLSFVEIKASTPLPEAATMREYLIKQARAIFRRKLWLDILAGIGYAAFGAIALIIAGDKKDAFIPDNSGLTMGLTLILYSVISYIAFKGQFRAHGHGLLQMIGIWERFIGFISNPRYSIYFASYFILLIIYAPFVDSNPDNILSDKAKWALAISAIPAVMLHALLWIWLFRYYRTRKNYKLLVLRVFDIDHNAKFTFNGLLRYWRHFGSSFTVADPSLLKSQINIGWKLFWLVILSSILAAISVYTPDTLTEKIELFVFFALSFAAYIILPLRYRLRTMERNVISNAEGLEKQLVFIERWPRRITHTFRDQPVVCYDSTWQMAVKRFIQSSQVILMDLRGFTDARKGCKTEVKLLFEMAPLKRLTFLVDEDWSNVKTLLQECWQKVGSNAAMNDDSSPQVNIYVATKKNSEDIQGIMDTLLHSAIVSAQV